MAGGPIDLSHSTKRDRRALASLLALSLPFPLSLPATDLASLNGSRGEVGRAAAETGSGASGRAASSSVAAAASSAASASAGPAGALPVGSCSSCSGRRDVGHGRERGCSREENGAASTGEEEEGRRRRRVASGEGCEQRLHQFSFCNYFLLSLFKNSSSSSVSLFSLLFSNCHHPPIYDQPAEAPRRGSEAGAQRVRRLEEARALCSRGRGVEEAARVRESFCFDVADLMNLFASLSVAFRFSFYRAPLTEGESDARLLH